MALGLSLLCATNTQAAAVSGSFEALPDTETLSKPLSPRSATPRRLFLNFDGGAMTYGEQDDATRNMTRSYDLATSLRSFDGSAADRAAIVQAVRADWEDYNVAVTSNRPISGDYMMTVVGPNQPASDAWENILGTAFLDCWDAQVDNDVSFAFHGDETDTSAAVIARTISQEIAHGFGLEHVDETRDIMFPRSSSGDPAFMDNCNQVVEAPGLGIYCTAQHTEICGSPSKQNAHEELLSMLGPALPDNLTPNVYLDTGIDGMEIPGETTFVVRANAEDERAIDHVVLYQDGEPLDEDREYPFEWVIDDAPIGPVDFRAQAYDLSGNAGISLSVTVFVGTEAPRRRRGNTGGGCSVGGTAPLPTGSLLMLLAVLLRRRRNANA